VNEVVVLSRANLSYSIIINSKTDYNLEVNEKTNFIDAIIDDPKFIDYIKKFSNKIPKKIENKRELKIKLEERGVNRVFIIHLLASSKLHD